MIENDETCIHCLRRHRGLLRPDCRMDSRDAAGDGPRAVRRRRAGRPDGRRRRRRRPPSPCSTKRRPRRCATSPRRTPPTCSRACSSGNMYFDAERYQEAIRWYDEAFKLNSRDVERQHRSRRLLLLHGPARPRHPPARGFAADRPEAHEDPAQPRHREGVRQAGPRRRAAAWEEVIKLEPGSPEAQAAQRALANLAAAHPGGAAMPPPGTPAAHADAEARRHDEVAAADAHDDSCSGRCSCFLVGRAIRRFFAGVAQGAAPPPPRAAGRASAPGQGRVDGARSRVRDLRAAVARRVDARQVGHALLLFGQVPRRPTREAPRHGVDRMARPAVLITRRIPASVIARLEAACDVDLYDGAGAIPRRRTEGPPGGQAGADVPADRPRRRRGPGRRAGPAHRREHRRRLRQHRLRRRPRRAASSSRTRRTC